jgi:hypothetical protein
MHYSDHAFSCNGNPVFRDLNGNYIYNCGGTTISDGDASLIKEIYK